MKPNLIGPGLCLSTSGRIWYAKLAGKIEEVAKEMRMPPRADLTLANNLQMRAREIRKNIELVSARGKARKYYTPPNEARYQKSGGALYRLL
jgi:hypothetical protein